MNSNDIVNIAVDSIKIGPGRRKVGDVQALAKSIEATGLINPIVVTQDRLLITGAHRLEAFKLLGRIEIPAKILECDEAQAVLMEMDEDLMRNELTPLQRALRIFKRKSIFDTKAALAKVPNGNELNAPRAAETVFTEDIALKFGFSQRTVQEDLQIAQGLTAETIEILEGSDVAKHKKTLLRLAKMNKEHQVRVAKRLTTGESFFAAMRAELQTKSIEFVTETGEKPAFHLFHGLLEEHIAPHSVDLVLTNSPNPKNDFKMYESFFKVAENSLVAGGFLVIVTWQNLLPKIFASLDSIESELRYVSTIAVSTKRSIEDSKWQPILIFTKGKSDFTLPRYVIEGQLIFTPLQLGSHSTLFKSLLSTFSKPGDTVVDPFANESNIGLETLKSGRRFLGIFTGPEELGVALNKRLSEFGQKLMF